MDSESETGERGKRMKRRREKSPTISSSSSSGPSRKRTARMEEREENETRQKQLLCAQEDRAPTRLQITKISRRRPLVVELLGGLASHEGGLSEPPLPKKPRMQCALSPPLAGAAGAATATTRSVAQRLKESSLKDGPAAIPSSQRPSTSGGRSPRSTAVNQSAKPGPALNRRQQNTIRIIAQYLRDLGLHESVESLVEESGCKVENAHAVRLREAILRGNWNEALNVLDKSYQFLSETDLDSAKLILFEEKFYDLLSRGELPLALKLLREDYPNKKNLRGRKTLLSNLLFMDAKEQNKNQEIQKHKSKNGAWRKQLATRIQRQLDPSYILPSKRLEHLTEQAWKYQISQCNLHFQGDNDGIDPDAIFKNHRCSAKDRPLFRAQQLLPKHSTEVWCLEFSPDGSKIASGSRNGEVFVWPVDARARSLGDPMRFRHNSGEAITCLAWSHDGRLLAVNGNDRLTDGDAAVYDTQSNCTVFRRLKPYNTMNSMTTFTTLSFYKGNKYRIFAANRHGQIQLHDLNQQDSYCGGFDGYRVIWLYAMQNGSCIAADTHQRIRQYNFSTKLDITLMQEESAIQNCAIHDDERYLMVVTEKNGLRVWDLETRTLIRSLCGVRYDKIIINPSFGGPSNMYACAGSLDGSVAVWNLDNSKPMARLERVHRGMVNAAKWSPSDEALLVTAGDDMHLRVFVANMISCNDGVRPPPITPIFPNTYGYAFPDKLPINNGVEKNGKSHDLCMTTQRSLPNDRLLLSNPGYSL
ncbi:unnamed protein product, partial [Mesorhabditis belari]|uniref:WD repeat-containing protein 26 n=1 Tax=Mesorhabditis belari TaxID=2138241 RepID=A0AAF3J554_9BILA